MRTRSFFVAIGMLIAASQPSAASSDMPDDAALSRIADAALAYYAMELSDVGATGLQEEIPDCYKRAEKGDDQAKTAFCVALDYHATMANSMFGPKVALLMPFFSEQAFHKRVRDAITKSTAAPYRSAFAAAIDAHVEQSARRFLACDKPDSSQSSQ
jgi:hypothetical protein